MWGQNVSSRLDETSCNSKSPWQISPYILTQLPGCNRRWTVTLFSIESHHKNLCPFHLNRLSLLGFGGLGIWPRFLGEISLLHAHPNCSSPHTNSIWQLLPFRSTALSPKWNISLPPQIFTKSSQHIQCGWMSGPTVRYVLSFHITLQIFPFYKG